MRQTLYIAIAALFAASTVPKFFTPTDNAVLAIAQKKINSPEPELTDSRIVAIRRSDNGHFNVEASVDGRRMNFLVDTGASVIALREQDAANLGIHPAIPDFTANVETANGTIRGARVELNRVEIGGLVVSNVAALVLPDEALRQNLLGMSFLSRVRWQQENGTLFLEQ